MTLNDVRDWIRTASSDDLNNVSGYIKLRRDQIGAEVGMSFVLGDLVQFDSGKGRGPVVGKFMGIKRKNASVITNEGVRWTVSPGLLRKVSVRKLDDAASAAAAVVKFPELKDVLEKKWEDPHSSNIKSMI